MLLGLYWANVPGSVEIPVLAIVFGARGGGLGGGA
jgi:hypothetical protein